MSSACGDDGMTWQGVSGAGGCGVVASWRLGVSLGRMGSSPGKRRADPQGVELSCAVLMVVSSGHTQGL